MDTWLESYGQRFKQVNKCLAGLSCKPCSYHMIIFTSQAFLLVVGNAYFSHIFAGDASQKLL